MPTGRCMRIGAVTPNEPLLKPAVLRCRGFRRPGGVFRLFRYGKLGAGGRPLSMPEMAEGRVNP